MTQFTVYHKKSNQATDGKPKLPTQEQLKYGEIAINYGENIETISIKNSANDIVTFSADNITDKKIQSKQDLLKSGTNIKTINGSSILGSGNIDVTVDTSSFATKTELQEKADKSHSHNISDIQNIDSSWRTSLNASLGNNWEMLFRSNVNREWALLSTSLGTNWETLLTVEAGQNWEKALGTDLGTSWEKALGTEINSSWPSILHGTPNFANTSHTHTASQITDLQGKLDAKANTSHTHTASQITDLQGKLDAKANTSHTHTLSNINDMSEAWKSALKNNLGEEWAGVLTSTISSKWMEPFKMNIQSGWADAFGTKLPQSWVAMLGNEVDFGWKFSQAPDFAPTTHNHTLQNITDIESNWKTTLKRTIHPTWQNVFYGEISSAWATPLAMEIQSGWADAFGTKLPQSWVVALGNEVNYASKTHRHATYNIDFGSNWSSLLSLPLGSAVQDGLTASGSHISASVGTCLEIDTNNQISIRLGTGLLRNADNKLCVNLGTGLTQIGGNKIAVDANYAMVNASNTWTAYQDFTAGAGNSGSDMRFKEVKKETIENVLPTINQIKIFPYIWKKQGETSWDTFGVDADQLIKLGGIFEKMVHERNDNEKTKFVDYERFGLIAVKAIQELNNKIDKLIQLYGNSK